MKHYNGLNFKPIFYSEIASSFLLYDIFNYNKVMAKDFMSKFLGLNVEGDIYIAREKSYRGKGSIDLFFSFEQSGFRTQILLEVKVHDYLSATPGQIRTYYEAALEEHSNEQVYFIYLTQFNKENASNLAIQPPTVEEFTKSLKVLTSYRNKLLHLNWTQVYHFIEAYEQELSLEHQLMLSLQKQWMLAEIEQEIKNNQVDTGNRPLEEFFDDVNIDLVDALSFGRKVNKRKRLVWEVDLEGCNQTELAKVLEVIKAYAASERINKKVKRKTGESTITAVKSFLGELAADETNWKLLTFYSSLFNFLCDSEYLYINGTGGRGFSIRVTINGKTEISLCTLWNKKTVEFGLKR